MQLDGKLYRIGELASITNLSKRTIDYYTHLGLLTTLRSQSNYRYYSEDTLDRLKLIQLFKAEKLSLDEIRERLIHLDERQVSAADALQKIQEISKKLSVMENDLLELKPLLSTLDDKQRKSFTRQVSLQFTSLFHTLILLSGENPFL